MKTYILPPEASWPALMQRATENGGSVLEAVTSIIAAIKLGGDRALLRYTEALDGAALSQVAVPDSVINTATVAKALESAIKVAATNIERFHQAQRTSPIIVETMPGVRCWQKQVAITRVGLYIPGGSAPLLSTLLMLAIPARVAGCREIVVCTPPDKEGKIPSSIAYIASMLGIEEVYSIGGAQAIAALAYGTETIRKVDKIYGPGNQYVTAAKMQVQQDGVAIDMPAGPSELLIIADDSASPDYVAADLLSQAEHGIDSQVILLSDSRKLIDGVLQSIDRQLQDLPRADIARTALSHSRAIQLETVEQCVAWSNVYAPEHLILNCQSAKQVAEAITAAGSVFIGPYSCESAGDYASGTNHTLPTNGAAAAYSGVNLSSFCKSITYQQLSREGLYNLAPTITTMARAERLEAHARAVTIRTKTTKR